MKDIFLSYSWKSKEIANKIYHDLNFIGLNVIKDDHKLRYKDKLSSFMKTIRNADYAILIICEDYLKSTNCMTEILEIQKDDDIWNKILPVISKDANIYDLEGRIKYVNYWQEKTQKIESLIKNLDPINATATYEELKSYKSILLNIDSFLTSLKDRLCISPEELFKKYYRPFFEEMDIEPDFSRMAYLIPISYTKDPKKRSQLVNKFIKKTKIQNSSAFSILASCYRDLGLFKEAIKTYNKAIKLDSFNYSAWNNLGEVYRWGFKNYEEAKKAYEKAIEIKPDLDIPRLNLGTLLSDRFDSEKKAKEQYEEILKFDENNAKAHNNLANIYKSKEFLDIDKAEYHLQIAITQNNIEAIINYANLLKVYRKNFELGNKYYEKARELDKDNLYSEIIDVLIKSEKG